MQTASEVRRPAHTARRRIWVGVVGALVMLEVRDRGAWLSAQKENFAELPELASRIDAERGQ